MTQRAKLIPMNLSGDFSVEDWVDFVRNVGSADLRLEMRKHLDAGCPSCTAACDAWTRIADTAGSEALYDPPPAALRMAKALYIPPRNEGPLERALEAARLVFDSYVGPAVAGVRGAARPPRKLLYACGALSFDLQIQLGQRDPDPVVIIGQVTNGEAGRGVEGVQVRVLSQQRAIALVRTNQLGEFYAEVQPRARDLSLLLVWEQGGTLISLDDLTRMDS